MANNRDARSPEISVVPAARNLPDKARVRTARSAAAASDRALLMSHIGRYLRTLSVARAALWCYLMWYLTMAAFYFDPAPRLWLTSLGLSAIVGLAFMLSVHAHGGTRQHRWQVFRLFLIPFCVSSFSALVKDHGFVLVFSPRLDEDALALGLCLAFLVVATLARHRATG